MKKNDLVLAAVILAAALLALGGMRIFMSRNTREPEAVVTVDGKEYGRYPLEADYTKKIELENGSFNLLVIRDNEADIEEASCPDKVCVKHSPINRKGETLVCLPNKVVVEIVNGEAAEVDSSTR